MRRCPLCQPPLFSFLFFFFFFFPSARSHSFKNTRKKTWGKIGYCVTRSHKSPTARCTRNLNKCNTWHLAADHCLPCCKLSVVILYRDKSALASLQSTEKKPSSDWKRLPKRDYSRHSSPPFFSFFLEKKNTPLMKFLAFPDVIPAEAQQGPIPRQSLVMRLQERGVTRVHHCLIISSLLLCLGVQLDAVTL